MKNIILVLLTIFFLNGCGNTKPEIIEKIVYVDRPVPKMRILDKVEFYQISDYKSFDDKYWLINKVEFDLASDRIKKKEHSIQFYEKQNMVYNRDIWKGDTK